MWYDGELVSNYEAPKHWVPAAMTADQVREVNARTDFRGLTRPARAADKREILERRQGRGRCREGRR